MKMRNPQAFNQVEQLRKNNGNPMEMFKQATNGYSEEQMNNFWKNIKKFGVPDTAIKQFQQEMTDKPN